jgi:hypothetical protein
VTLGEWRFIVSLEFILKSCVAIYIVTMLIELMIRRRWLRFAFEVVILVTVVAVALLLNNAVTGRVAFGESVSQASTVGIMFVATVCGISARFIFYLQTGQFSWLSFFKPIAISPIVLLPLIGSVQQTGELNTMQVVSFALLAFQNGFFWHAVLEGAKPTAQTVARSTNEPTANEPSP